MAKDSFYVLDFNKGKLDQPQNRINRTGDCKNGGSHINILIRNPETEMNEEDKIIIGVELVVIPYIPDQNQGKSQEFPEKHYHYNFDEGDINVTVTAIPEYSYKIFGYFKAYFGRLRPSEEIYLPGEFEKLMEQVGCFVRNEYRMDQNETASNETKELIRKTYHTMISSTSLIDCATSCHLNGKCTEGWSYQIATKHCYYHDQVEIEKLQPGSTLPPHEHTIGWATGLKSCSSIGKNH